MRVPSDSDSVAGRALWPQRWGMPAVHITLSWTQAPASPPAHPEYARAGGEGRSAGISSLKRVFRQAACTLSAVALCTGLTACSGDDGVPRAATPTATSSPTPTASPSVTASKTATPSITPTATATATGTTEPSTTPVSQLASQAVVVYYSAENSSALTLTGSSLGPPAPPPGTPSPYYVVVTYTDDSTQTIRSDDTRVHVWTADTITLRLDQPTRQVGAVTVFTPTWRSTVQPQIVNYDLDFFYTDPDASQGGSLPATIIADPLGQVWVNSQFHHYLLYFEPLVQAVLHIPTYPPLPADVYPYTVCLASGCVRARCSAWGESVVLDTEDRVWFAESGAEPTMSQQLDVNHARIVSFDIHTQAPKLYNVPGNRNSVMGIAWDAGRRRIWFTQTAYPYGETAKLISFDPDRIPDQEFDFNWSPDWNPAIDTQCTIPSGATAGTCDNNPNHICLIDDDCILVERLCQPGTTDDSNCYHEYELAPGTYQPAQLAVHPDGAIWYTHYFVASDIGRLIPETGEIFLFRMSPAPTGLATAFPYDIEIAPNGDVTAVGFYSGKLAHIQPEFFANRSCTQLVSPLPDVACTVDPKTLMTDPTCYNPCIQETVLPGAWASENIEKVTNAWVAFPSRDSLGVPCLREATVPGGLSFENIQWVARNRSAFLGYDGLGDLWVGHGCYLQEREFIYMPPIRDLYPSEYCTSTTAHAAIGDSFAFESDGCVWAVDFCGRRMTRLRPRPQHCAFERAERQGWPHDLPRIGASTERETTCRAGDLTRIGQLITLRSK